MAVVIIRLQNLPMSANTSSIRRFFAGLNIPEGGVHIVGGDDGDAFIAFATDEDARKAMLLDRQSINSSCVRLFLSSKSEMQSVIESARSSVLLPVKSQPQTIPFGHQNRPDPQKLGDIQLSVHGVNGSGFADKGSRPDSGAQYSYQSKQPLSGIPRSETNSTQQFPDPARDVFQKAVAGPRKDQMMEQLSQGRLNYEHNKQAWDQNCPENFRIQTFKSPSGRDTNNVRSAPDSRPERMYESEGNYSQSFATDVPPESDYSFSSYKSGFQEKSPMERHQRADFHEGSRLGQNPHSEQYDNQCYQSRSYTTDDFSSGAYDSRKNQNYYQRDFAGSEARDFSVRPPWLREENPPFPKRPNQFDDQEKTESGMPVKRCRPSGDSHELVPDTDFVCKVSFVPADVSVKAVFDVLRGVNIIPKWGIRLEEDALKRFTGYVYIMMNGRDSLDRALACSGSLFRGKPIQVTISSPEMFYRVTDTNFQNKCPPDLRKKIPPRSSVKPPYFTDGCLEVGGLPPDVAAAEVVTFLGAPGLTPNDVVVVPTSGRDSAGTCAAVRLPSSKDLDILLSARPRPFRGGEGNPVRLTAISKLQFDSYSHRNPARLPASQQSKNTTQRETAFSPQPAVGPKTCAFMTGFARPLDSFEVSRFFPSVIIPGDAIHIVNSSRAALIHFISETNCKKALGDFSDNEAKLKAEHPNIVMYAITLADFKQRLGSTPNSDVGNSPGYRSRPADQDGRDFRQPMSESVRFPRQPGPNSNDFSQYPRPPPQQRPPFFNGQQPNRSDGFPRRPGPPFGGPRPRMPPPNMSPASQRPDMPRGVNVFISNLPPSASPDTLIDVLRPYYPLPGSLRLRRDSNGHPMGDAIIALPSVAEAERAVHELNGYRLYGRNMVLRYERGPLRNE